MTSRCKVFLVSVLLSFAGSTVLFAKDVIVKGTVVDETGMPLIGAGVLSQDGKRGTVTDIDGKYIIKLDDTDKIIKYSFLGYATLEVVVNDRSEINLTLQPDKSTTIIMVKKPSMMV